jgi:pyrroloquinoline quinone biosynthesis protein B
MIRLLGVLVVFAWLWGCGGTAQSRHGSPDDGSFVIVLGIAQDGGVPQAGSLAESGWTQPADRRRVACLGIVDGASGGRWMLDATPDFPTQSRDLFLAAPAGYDAPLLNGIFLTHAHIGHYTGLMYLGKEVLGARGVTVWAMPRMRAFLESNGPWSQLVSQGNIVLAPLRAGEPVELRRGLSVTPIEVPHRQEFSEVVGFRIAGPHRRVLFIPDIDSWEQWDALGTGLEDELRAVDVAYLDGTFFSGNEVPGRDMSLVPHPLITHTMDRLAPLPPSERAKVRFIHLNHTNRALWEKRDAARRIKDRGFAVAVEGERVDL